MSWVRARGLSWGNYFDGECYVRMLSCVFKVTFLFCCFSTCLKGLSLTKKVFYHLFGLTILFCIRKIFFFGLYKNALNLLWKLVSTIRLDYPYHLINRLPSIQSPFAAYLLMSYCLVPIMLPDSEVSINLRRFLPTFKFLFEIEKLILLSSGILNLMIIVLE